MEPRFARLMPEVTISISPVRLADLAAKALAPKQANVLSLAHLHAPLVSVREQAMVVVDRLRQQRAMTFRALTHDSSTMLTTVARFLALLELFRDGAVAFEQLTPLGELTIRWTGADDAVIGPSPTNSTKLRTQPRWTNERPQPRLARIQFGYRPTGF